MARLPLAFFEKEREPGCVSVGGMKVVVVEHDPQWARDFEALRGRIWPVVEDFAVGMEHVGSTSVPGLAAKPILDIDVILGSEKDLPMAIERLASIDYTHRGN